MSYCLNPYCSRPQNPDATKFCSHCGFKLLLGDRYRAVKPIGRGGFGRTFLAVDEYKPSRPPCVIKQFCPQVQNVSNQARARDLFRREAIQLEQLGRHPQIPELLAHFEQADYQYLVQEFIDGENLLQEATRSGHFNDRQIWDLLNDLLPVLEFIHHEQVIHRDIKPQNIIRRHSSQQYVLVDFGAAKSIVGTDLSRTGTSIGSPEFIAPEQAIGKATYASDLYSLGVTCIYLLTQVRPADLFDTEEGCWIWRHHVNQPLNSVLADIVDKLLQAPIKRRYQAAADVLEDLHAPEIVTALSIAGADRGSSPPALSGVLRLDPVVDRVSAERQTAENSAATVLPATVLPDLLDLSTAPLWTCHRTLTGHLSWVRSIVFHPDGQSLASGSGDRTVKFWYPQTGELRQSLAAHTGWLRSIAVSPDGELLASCSNDRTVKLWQWDTGELRHTLNGHGDWVRSVAFSPNGQWLASSSQDKTIRLWQVATGQPLKSLTGHAHWITTVAFVPNTNNRLVSGSRDKTLKLWDLRAGKPIRTFEAHTDAINHITLTPDGRWLVSASDDHTVRLWDLATGKLVRTLTGHNGGVNAVAVSPDGATIASGSQDRTIKLWCVQTGILIQTLTGHTNWVWSVVFDTAGKTIASGGWDAAIKIWQVDLG